MNCYDVTYRSSSQGGATCCGNLSPPLKRWKAMVAGSLPPVVPPSPSSITDDVSHHSTGDVMKRKLSSSTKSDQPVSTLRLSNRCVLLTYFDGDVTSCIDEHFSRALRQSTSSMTSAMGDDQRCRQTTAEPRQYTAPDLTDRANCSMSQRHISNSDLHLHRAAAYRPPTTTAVDWSALMTSSFGAAAAPSGVGDCYCADSYGPSSEVLDCAPGWTQSLRFRPYYVWPEATSSSRAGPSHRHGDDITPSFAATASVTAPPYVDYHSLFASSRPYRHAAAATSGSGYRERNDIAGVMTSSLSGEVAGGDVGWTSLPSSSSFGVGSPATGALNRHDVTSMTSSTTTQIRHCNGPTDDEFPVQASHLLVAGSNSESQTKTSGKDLYWF